MKQEIERKFLCKNEDFKKESTMDARIIQGYLSTVPERTVRVRVMNERGFLTVKGKSSKSGLSRPEWEMPIPVADARNLLELCEWGVVDKFRYYVPVGCKTFEVDEFLGDNWGLLVAEIELGFEEESFERPSWLGEEVTGDPKYYNSNMLKNPYSKW